MTQGSDNKPDIEQLMPTSKHPYQADNMAVIEKVQQDIWFLTDRIERIKKLQTPNSSVLKTYITMLQSREAVLRWLEEDKQHKPPGAAHATEIG